MDADRFAELLGELAESMPEEFFRDLNGGVAVSEEAAEDENGLVFGVYRHDRVLGRWIEMYYGSFIEAYSEEEIPAALERELRRLLRRHMLELAGIYEE
ncbi:MAG: hypothetical protein IJU28_04765 [Clostridia bacterium]|nr:hypothetical protein [Clostridia bacterium]